MLRLAFLGRKQVHRVKPNRELVRSEATVIPPSISCWVQEQLRTSEARDPLGTRNYRCRIGVVFLTTFDGLPYYSSPMSSAIRDFLGNLVEWQSGIRQASPIDGTWHAPYDGRFFILN